MYFLFNEVDNSYNCHSDKPFPDFMKPNTYEIKTADDFDITAYGDITLSEYDPETGQILDNPKQAIRLKSEEGRNFLVSFFTSNEYLDQRKDPEMYEAMLNFARVFLPQNVFDSIVADNRIDDLEAQEIINTLDAIESSNTTTYDAEGNITSYETANGTIIDTTTE